MFKNFLFNNEKTKLVVIYSREFAGEFESRLTGARRDSWGFKSPRTRVAIPTNSRVNTHQIAAGPGHFSLRWGKYEWILYIPVAKFV